MNNAPRHRRNRKLVALRRLGWLTAGVDADNKSWENEYIELKTVLSPDEYAAARASTLNAHYTSPTVHKSDL